MPARLKKPALLLSVFPMPEVKVPMGPGLGPEFQMPLLSYPC